MRLVLLSYNGVHLLNCPCVNYIWFLIVPAADLETLRATCVLQGDVHGNITIMQPVSTCVCVCVCV